VNQDGQTLGANPAFFPAEAEVEEGNLMLGAVAVEAGRGVHEESFLFFRNIQLVFDQVDDFVGTGFERLVGHIYLAETMTANELFDGIHFFVDFFGVNVRGFVADAQRFLAMLAVIH
jgi:hypothetical protein